MEHLFGSSDCTLPEMHLRFLRCVFPSVSSWFGHKLDNGRVTVIVSDDGVGLGEHQEWPTPRKLGALILQTLKENARNVDFRAESIRGLGTWFTLMFDAAQAPVPN